MISAILVAGIGNVFLGDDAFGVEAAWALGRRRLPECVAVRDFGIRGFDLAYALLGPWDVVILLDALSRGNAPGTITVLEPDMNGLGAPESAAEIDPHGMDPMKVLQLAASMGSIPADVLVVGCEPQDFGDELIGRMGLSPPVKAAVEQAATVVEELIGRILDDEGLHPIQLQAER